MSTPILKVVTSKLKRGAPEVEASVGPGAPEPAVRWWRRMVSSVGPGRKRQVQATLQRLAQADVEDTLSEADVKTWLSMLGTKPGEPGESGTAPVAKGPKARKP